MSFRLARVVKGYQPVHCLPDGLIAWRRNTLYRADHELRHFEPICTLPVRAAWLARHATRLLTRILRFEIRSSVLVDRDNAFGCATRHDLRREFVIRKMDDRLPDPEWPPPAGAFGSDPGRRLARGLLRRISLQHRRFRGRNLASQSERRMVALGGISDGRGRAYPQYRGNARWTCLGARRRHGAPARPVAIRLRAQTPGADRNRSSEVSRMLALAGARWRSAITPPTPTSSRTT